MNGATKTLVAAVDQTRASQEAFDQALILALSMRARVTAVTVMPKFEGNMNLLKIPNARELMRQPFEEALKEAAAKAASHGIEVETVLSEGDPSDGIVSAAEAAGAGMIVLGNKRRNHMERVLVGNTAARTIGKSPCDVLLVPQGTQVDFNRILAAVDGSKYSMAAAQRALDLAMSYGGELFALSALDVPVERTLIYGVLEDARGKALAALNVLAKQGDTFGVKVTTEIREGAPYKVIAEYAEEKNAGLVSLGTFGKTGLRRFLMGSVVERALVLSPCPVLVVKELGEDGVRDFM